MKGRFITFEGMDKAGKSTQSELLCAWLKKLRYPVLTTREPGGTVTAERLRELVLAGDKMSGVSEALLMFAARQEHLNKVIRPALADGVWVLCDRFTDSTLAYQGGGHGVDEQWLRTIADGVHGDCWPDITFYLASAAQDSPHPNALLGAENTADRFEGEGMEFFGRVRQMYEKIAAGDSKRVVKINTYNGKKRVAKMQVAKVIQKCIEKRLLKK